MGNNNPFKDSILRQVDFPPDAFVVNSYAGDDIFVAASPGSPFDYQLNREFDSPALGATQEQDLGAFGGANPISVNLSTGSPRIETLNVSDSVSPTSGLRIQLEAVAGE